MQKTANRRLPHALFVDRWQDNYSSEESSARCHKIIQLNQHSLIAKGLFNAECLKHSGRYPMFVLSGFRGERQSTANYQLDVEWLFLVRFLRRTVSFYTELANCDTQLP